MTNWTKKLKNNKNTFVKIACGSIFLIINGCASLSSCVSQAGGSSFKPPCWLNNTKEGIVVQGSRGIRTQSETKLALLNEAILEFAKEEYGVNVKLDSTILEETTTTKKSGKELVSKNAKQTYIAEISTATESIPVKAKIKDYYYDPRIEKMWVWAIKVE